MGVCGESESRESANATVNIPEEVQVDPGWRIQVELVRNGRIGKVHTVHVHLPDDDGHLAEMKNYQGVPPEQPVHHARYARGIAVVEASSSPGVAVLERENQLHVAFGVHGVTVFQGLIAQRGHRS